MGWSLVLESTAREAGSGLRQTRFACIEPRRRLCRHERTESGKMDTGFRLRETFGTFVVGLTAAKPDRKSSCSGNRVEQERRCEDKAFPLQEGSRWVRRMIYTSKTAYTS